MNKCPKCSSYQISGPKFVADRGYESLRYICNRCGYARNEPTHDRAPDDIIQMAGVNWKPDRSYE